MSEVISLADRKNKSRATFDLDAVIAAGKANGVGGEPTPNLAEFEQKFPGDRRAGDDDYIVDSQITVTLVAERIEDMCMHFFMVMHYVPEIELIAEWWELTRRMGLKDLCDELRKSTSADWKVRPAYFTALNSEFFERMQVLLKIL
ncbi:MAG: hypothetical protein KBD06_04785 [Candidatus Pacebacteria bacterium]|nr:hypothetical protein [Candidatus Paceibacterota bacterium]